MSILSQFVLNYDRNVGFVVCAVVYEDSKGYRTYPLRNFGDRLGDAKIFQYDDCPKLTERQIETLIKNYDPNVKYKRINARHFERQKDDE